MPYYKCGKIFATQNSNTSIETASGAIANFRTSLAMPVLGCNAEFSASQASGTPTPSAPIPIVGVDKVNITRCGKNLWSNEKAVTDSNTATVYISDEWLNYKTGNNPLIYKLKSDTQVTFKAIAKAASNDILILRAYYTDGTYTQLVYVSLTANTETTISGTTASGKTLDFIRSVYTNNISMQIKNVQLEVGSTAAEYEPYNGTTVIINLGGTYYGGSVDAVTGKITLTHGVADMGELNWTYSTVREWFYDYSLDIISGSLDILSPVYAVKTVAELVNDLTLDNAITVNNNSIVVRNLAYTDANTFKTDMNGIILVYPLATPIVVYASNTAELYTKAGLNNVFCDTGDIEVKYRKLHSDN